MLGPANGVFYGGSRCRARKLPERVVMTTSQFAGGSPGWMPRGACHGEDPELFFPITAAGPGARAGLRR